MILFVKYSLLSLIIYQCSLWALEKDLEGSTLVVGGDGRFFMTEATDIIIRLIVFVFIIMITRPKPAFGRQGLVGSWGQDTDEVSTFLVFLTSHFAPVALSSDLTNLGPLMTMKIHLETFKNHGNQPKP